MCWIFCINSANASIARRISEVLNRNKNGDPAELYKISENCPTAGHLPLHCPNRQVAVGQGRFMDPHGEGDNGQLPDLGDLTGEVMVLAAITS